jgi:hypothetical protein
MCPTSSPSACPTSKPNSPASRELGRDAPDAPSETRRFLLQLLTDGSRQYRELPIQTTETLVSDLTKILVFFVENQMLTTLEPSSSSILSTNPRPELGEDFQLLESPRFIWQWYSQFGHAHADASNRIVRRSVMRHWGSLIDRLRRRMPQSTSDERFLTRGVWHHTLLICFSPTNHIDKYLFLRLFLLGPLDIVALSRISNSDLGKTGNACVHEAVVERQSQDFPWPSNRFIS